MKNDYTIAAKNAKEFTDIEYKLKKLPKSLLSQINLVEKKFGAIQCSLFTQHTDKVLISIPQKGLNFILISNNQCTAYATGFSFSLDKTEKQHFELKFIQ